MKPKDGWMDGKLDRISLIYLSYLSIYFTWRFDVLFFIQLITLHLIGLHCIAFQFQIHTCPGFLL